jgi:hypothetical protein
MHDPKGGHLHLSGASLKGQGICLRERVLVQFPDGSLRQGAIWQHTEGVRGIYAIAPDDKGFHMPYALEPVWVVQRDEDGQAIWQGMGPTNWFRAFRAGLRIICSKGLSKRLRLLNLA